MGPVGCRKLRGLEDTVDVQGQGVRSSLGHGEPNKSCLEERRGGFWEGAQSGWVPLLDGY